MLPEATSAVRKPEASIPLSRIFWFTTGNFCFLPTNRKQRQTVACCQRLHAAVHLKEQHDIDDLSKVCFETWVKSHRLLKQTLAFKMGQGKWNGCWDCGTCLPPRSHRDRAPVCALEKSGVLRMWHHSPYALTSKQLMGWQHKHI